MGDLEHFDRELYDLDRRIRRLGMACGVDLGRSEAIVALIKGDYSVCERADMPKRRELRGLLMLKYRIEEHCIESMGADQCRRIIDETDARLRKEGFVS